MYQALATVKWSRHSGQVIVQTLMTESWIRHRDRKPGHSGQKNFAGKEVNRNKRQVVDQRLVTGRWIRGRENGFTGRYRCGSGIGDRKMD